MGWEDWIDSMKKFSGNTDTGAIIGLDGSVWAQSASLGLTSEDVAWMLKNFETPSRAYAKGIYVADEKYYCTFSDGDTLRFKKGLCHTL
jgi:hypothetical protein